MGDIVDEYGNESVGYELLGLGDYLVDGAMSVSDLGDLLELELPDEDWDTVAGFVFGTLGHVPVPGESVELDGWRFAAETVEGRRIRQVRVSLVPSWDEADASGPDRAVDA